MTGDLRKGRNPAGRGPSLTGVILAGGKSSRMGANKALLTIDGQNLVQRLVARLERLCDHIVLVANDPDPYRELGLPIVGDVFPGNGPLAGIHAGLSASTTAHCLVVACDMPHASVDLGEYMARQTAGYDVVVPAHRGGLEPLHALYSRSCLPHIEARLTAAGRRDLRIISFYPDVAVRQVVEAEIEPFGHPTVIFYNINTREDYERLRAGVGGAQWKGAGL